MTYRQITEGEGYTLSGLRRLGLTAAATSRVPGRHPSTILREVRRNRKAFDRGYRPELANWYANGRRSRSRRNRRFSNDVRATIAARVNKGPPLLPPGR
jgi:IS30 family transposase